MKQAGADKMLEGVLRVAVLDTAPMARTIAIVEKIKEIIPSASFLIATRAGAPVTRLAEAQGVEIIEALPDGMFGLRGMFRAGRSALCGWRPEAVVIVYNNAEGKGYEWLELFASSIGPAYGADHRAQFTRVTIGMASAAIASRLAAKALDAVFSFALLVSWPLLLARGMMRAAERKRR